MLFYFILFEEDSSQDFHCKKNRFCPKWILYEYMFFFLHIFSYNFFFGCALCIRSSKRNEFQRPENFILIEIKLRREKKKQKI